MAQLPQRQPAPSLPAKVVFLLEELNFGGTQRQTLELARRLDRRKFKSEIWVLRSGEALAPLARTWQIPLVPLAPTSIVGPRSLVHLWRRLHREKIDLFLTLTAIPNIWGRLLGKVAGLPCIIGNVRGNTPHRQHERWLWPLTHHLICNNKKIQSFLQQEYNIPPQRLSLIPNGVDTDFFAPSGPNRGNGNLKVLSIGRLVPDKDQATLLQAFSLVLQDHPNTDLWLVGNGPCKNQLDTLIRQKFPASRVVMLPGQVDIRPFFHRASLFVLSSVTEALPNVVLEAMASGLPIVATNVGGLPEVVNPGQTGLLVPPKEPARLAQAILQLLADEELRRAFGRAGRERVVREYSFNRMVRRYEVLFDALLAQKGSRP